MEPDVLVLRTEKHLDDHMRMKVAGFCNVDLECVIQSEDLPSIYEVPVNMQRQGLDSAIMRTTFRCSLPVCAPSPLQARCSGSPFPARDS